MPKLLKPSKAKRGKRIASQTPDAVSVVGTKRWKDKRTKPSAKSSGRKLVPQPHGGALLPGAGGGPQPGSGRPPDALRARLREVGLSKGLPLIERTIDGQLSISLIGKCEACEHEQQISEEWVELVMNRFKTTTDQQLKATELSLKHGLASKELVIASDTAAAFFDCVSTAIVELYGPAAQDAVKARALALMEAKA